jgi:hypothetical protein
MPEKISLRLSHIMHRDLQQAARRRRMTPSAFIRLALAEILEPSTPTSAPSASLSSDAWERLLMTCPMDIQGAVHQTVGATGLPLERVLKALIITACQRVPTSSPERSDSTCLAENDAPALHEP